MNLFRTCSTVLGIVYIFLMIYQKATQKKFPSERFENRTIMALHIICGVMIVYLGCFLHIQNEIKPVLKSCDESETYRIILYYVMGSMSFIHSLTVLCISPFVMGEKRITVPLYIGAGLVNLHNGIILIINPGLQNAFTLWGSVNTFMYQRAILVLLMFANIDWELLYTYSLLAGATMTYTWSYQQQYLYFLLLLPILYAPFHEKVYTCFKMPLEDTIANEPSTKNITEAQKELRSVFEKVICMNNNSKRKVACNNAKREVEEDDKNSTNTSSV